MKINNAIVNIEVVDEETGELTNKELDITDLIAEKLSKVPTKKKSSSSKIEENDDLILRLEDNKYILTSGALKALNVELGETRLVIQYQKIGKLVIPVIGTNDTFSIKSGNKVTLSGTVSCRGKANEELSEYGNEFILVEHPSVGGLYILTQDGNIPEGDYAVKTSKKLTKKEPVKEIPQPEEEIDEIDDLLKDNTNLTDDDYTL